MKAGSILLRLIPAGFGLLLSLLLNLTALPNPVLYLRADVGSLLFGLSLLITGGLLIQLILSHRTDQMLYDLHAQNAADRRRFLRLLDHELKNPLTAIMAGLANLGADAPPEQQKPTLESIENQVQRLNKLVTDLRKLSDLETRQVEQRPVNLPALLEEVYDLSRARVGDQRKFNLLIPQTPWPLPEILGDHDLLFLAIHNLIDNAIKFTQPGDSVELRASEDGRTVLVEIADSGPGIPEDELDLVWDELFRGKAARGIPGSGIGLALVQAIVRRHQGTVAIRSRAGKGTVISLRLPLNPTTNP